MSGTASGKWLARIRNGKEQMHLGTFDNEQEAARAYDKEIVAQSLDRPLNFPRAATIAYGNESTGGSAASLSFPAGVDEGAVAAALAAETTTTIPLAIAAASAAAVAAGRQSIFLGVKRNTDGTSTEHGNWVAGIMVRGREKYIGTFDADKDAAMAYDKAVIAHSLDLPLNFPRSVVEAAPAPSQSPPQKSIYRGVYRNKNNKKWIAKITVRTTVPLIFFMIKYD